jgi:hypothetical protein
LPVPREARHDVGKTSLPGGDLFSVVDDHLALSERQSRRERECKVLITGNTIVQIPVQANDAGGETASAAPTACLVFWMNCTAEDTMPWPVDCRLATSKYSCASLEKHSSPGLNCASSPLSGSLCAAEGRREPRGRPCAMLL